MQLKTPVTSLARQDRHHPHKLCTPYFIAILLNFEGRLTIVLKPTTKSFRQASQSSHVMADEACYASVFVAFAAVSSVLSSSPMASALSERCMGIFHLGKPSCCSFSVAKEQKVHGRTWRLRPKNACIQVWHFAQGNQQRSSRSSLS